MEKQKEFVCACGKDYTTKQALSRHGNTCDIYQSRKKEKQPLNVFNINIDKSKTTNNIDNSKTVNKTVNNIDNSQTNITNNNITIHVPILYDTRYPDLTKEQIDSLVRKYYVEQNLGNIIPDIYTEPKNASFKSISPNQFVAFYSPDGIKYPRWLPIDMETLRYKIAGAIEDNLGDIIFQTNVKKKEPNYASFKFQDDMREPPPPRLLKIQEKAIKKTANINKLTSIIPDGREEGVFYDTDKGSETDSES